MVEIATSTVVENDLCHPIQDWVFYSCWLLKVLESPHLDLEMFLETV